MIGIKIFFGIVEMHLLKSSSLYFVIQVIFFVLKIGFCLRIHFYFKTRKENTGSMK